MLNISNNIGTFDCFDSNFNASFIHNGLVSQKSAQNRTKSSGSFQSQEAKESKETEEFLKFEKKQFEKLKQEPRVLLLGSPDSGKSTLLKTIENPSCWGILG
jgi:polynucleotide 5'-kinase involved in rRNA processing